MPMHRALIGGKLSYANYLALTFKLSAEVYTSLTNQVKRVSILNMEIRLMRVSSSAL